MIRHQTSPLRLCYPWFEAWSHMPPVVPPGSGTKTYALDIVPRGTTSPLIWLVFEQTSPGVPHHSGSSLSLNRHPTHPGPTLFPLLVRITGVGRSSLIVKATAWLRGLIVPLPGPHGSPRCAPGFPPGFPS